MRSVAYSLCATAPGQTLRLNANVLAICLSWKIALMVGLMYILDRPSSFLRRRICIRYWSVRFQGWRTYHFERFLCSDYSLAR